MVIKKKIWKEYFDIVASGKKNFELRLIDFNVKEGDVLVLEEWDSKIKKYTGRKIEKKVGYVLKFKIDDFGQGKEIKEKGLQVISLKNPLKKFGKMIFGKYVLDFKKTIIMGVLNVTPDSFSDGGDFLSLENAVAHAKKMVQEGADIIDVGGESSKPKSEPISIEEELRRVKTVIEKLSKEIKVPISIDTYKPEVAEMCIKAGASIINDITGLGNSDMVKIAVKYKTPVVIMHMQGTPKNMQDSPRYKNVVEDVAKFFEERISIAKKAGIKNIIIDPGIGFGKTIKNNLEIIKRLEEFSFFGCPILVGTSRKSFIGKINKIENPKDRLSGSIASMCLVIKNGANIVRVHDVKECKRAVEVVDAINAE